MIPMQNLKWKFWVKVSHIHTHLLPNTRHCHRIDSFCLNASPNAILPLYQAPSPFCPNPFSVSLKPLLPSSQPPYFLSDYPFSLSPIGFSFFHIKAQLNICGTKWKWILHSEIFWFMNIPHMSCIRCSWIIHTVCTSSL